jgi:hypothetical protein
MLKYKIVIIFFIALVSTGCASKLYHSPSLNFIVKDAVSQEIVQGVKLNIGPASDEKTLIISNNEGQISLAAEYDIKPHLYPFPIPSRGMAMPALFSISRAGYSDYKVECLYMTLGNGECAPIFIESLKKKKALIFECEFCCTYTSILGKVKAIDVGDKERYEFTIKNELKSTVTSNQHKINFPTLNSEQIKRVKNGDDFSINILTSGYCRGMRLPFD